MSTFLTDAAYPDPDAIRDTILRAVRFTYARIGIKRNVSPGSDDYVRIDKIAGRIGIAIANNELAAEDADPMSATGTALITLAGIFGVFPRPAGPGAGAVTIQFSGPSCSIPSNFKGTAPNGKQYVATPGTYLPGKAVNVISSDTGPDTNQLAGTVITWNSAAIGFLNPSALVTSAGITGGAPADDDEALRQRLLQRLASAAGGGNWSELVAWAESSSASIQAAYVYAAVEGWASYDVAATKVGGDRTLPVEIIQQMAAFILSKMPGQQKGNFTTVTPEYVDVTLLAELPLPQLAGGAGGGWRDNAPWPAEDALVTAYDPTTGTATVNATATPSLGSSIGVWDPTSVDPQTGAVGQMLEYNVSSFGGSAGAWTITVQATGGSSGFQVSPLGCYLSAGAVSLISYATLFAAQVALLGPGQKTNLPDLLPRAARQPAPDVRTPANLTNRLTDAVIDAYTEVLDLNYALRVATGTMTSLTSPSIPGTTADPPHVLVLKNLAIHA